MADTRLRDQRCQGCALHAHIQREHEQRVEHGVQHRTDQHGEHTGLGEALAGDEGVQSQGQPARNSVPRA